MTNHPPPKSFCDVVELWGTPDRLADEIGAPIETARKWRQRDRIPQEWWLYILRTKRARASGVTADLLARIAAQKKRAQA